MDTSSSLYAILLGIVQGITEFLPVSSSGHLIIVSWLADGKPLPLALNIALHCGTLLAVLIYFWRDWSRLGKGVLSGEKSQLTLFGGIVIGTLPAAILGLLFADRIEQLFHSPIWVAVQLILFGFIMWYVDKTKPSEKGIADLSVRDCFSIGLLQTLALIPGTSRSGATIVGGRLLGLDRQAAARFSFLLGAPVFAGATVLKYKEILAHGNEPVFYLGIIVSFVVGIGSIHFLLKFVAKNSLLAFAIYRALLGVAIFSYWLSSR